jgi:phage-related protein (TIGR01555 family)
MTATNTDALIARLEAENEALRLDGILKNLASKIGVIGADPRTAATFGTTETPTLQEIDEWFESDKFFAKLIEDLPRLESKKWAIISVTHDRDTGDMTQALQKLIDSTAPIFTTARITARKYGGSAIVLAANDGVEDTTQPIRKETLKSIRLVGVREAGISQQIMAREWGTDPMSEYYNQPTLYQFSDPGMTLVHPDRLLLFKSVDVGDRRSREAYNGFSVPLLKRCKNELVNYRGALDTIATALLSFNRLVVKLKNLVALLDAKKQKEIEARLQLYQYTAGVMSAYVGDPEDVIEYLNRSFVGVNEMLQWMKLDLGACADEPHTTFFNESPSGNTSGTDQKNNLNNIVATSQELHIRTPLEKLIDLWCHCKESPTKGIPPKSYELTFPVVYELNETERAALKKTEAETYALLLKGNGQEGVVNPIEVAEAISRDVPLASTIDLEARLRAKAEFEQEGMVLSQESP